jgi:uncharacterized protein YdeI (YjbR/CyaY-like superfamily)
MAGSFKQRTKRIPLGFIGQAWQDADAYIETRFLTIGDSRDIIRKVTEVGDDDNRAIEEALATVQRLFVAGMSVDAGGQLVELTADDLEQAFDAEAVLALYARALGNPDPKASVTSTTTTPVAGASQTSA